MLLKKKYFVGGMVLAGALSYGFIPSMIGKTRYFTQKKEPSKVIYLTFDDGPSSQYTESLLDLLKEYDIKATFFMVGNFAWENPEIVARAKKDGHLIGIHSLNHRSALLQTPWYTNREFRETMSKMKSLGIKPKYYRPPWGQVNVVTLKNIKKYNLKKVIWNVMAEDWEGNTTADIIAYKLLKRTKTGDVVCLHDGRGKNNAPKRTIEALKTVLPIWIEEGYEFKLISEKGEYNE